MGELVTEGPISEEVGVTQHTRVLALINDVPTRWNSTYYMLRRALVLQESIDEYL